MSLPDFPKSRKRARRTWMLLAAAVVVVLAALAYWLYAYRYAGVSARWSQYNRFKQDPQSMAAETLLPGWRCDEAPFAFPTSGVIFGSWGQSYRPLHRHQGLDIFAGTEPGVTPVYAAYSGYLSRLEDWVSSVIIRIPQDPLQPARQIWTYYTHMATEDGDSFVSPAFPPGTADVYIEEGTFLGYQGNYSGDPVNPTGLHLHFSIVKDDGQGSFMNELDIGKTLDPTPYFNLPVNFAENPDRFPVCAGQSTYAGWSLVPEGR
jgi:murein DD-endopeptidase MepM/ murein hydrolase activator NlpD